MATDVLPSQHWACYYSRVTGERVGPASLRVAFYLAEEAAGTFKGVRKARDRRIMAARVVRESYRVGGRA